MKEGKHRGKGTLRWGMRKCGIKERRNRERKRRRQGYKRCWTRVEGGAALGSSVLTLGSFLPNLSPAKAGQAL